MAGDGGTGGVQSKLPAEPHQDGEGHGGTQVVHGERDLRGSHITNPGTAHD